MVMVFGEITTKAKVNYEEIVRKTCKEIGFTSEDVGLDADNCKVGLAVLSTPRLECTATSCNSNSSHKRYPCLSTFWTEQLRQPFNYSA